MFETRTDLVVRGGLNGLAARHRVFVNNVANAETPGFKPSDVSFQDQLRQVRDRLLENPLADATSAEADAQEIVPSAQTSDRGDENGVSIDKQVMLLEENRLTYEALAMATKLRGDILKSAILESPR